MKYKKIYLSQDISIENIYTIHYMEYYSGYSFSGEMHDFWELVYIDKGACVITSDNTKFSLNQGEFYLHKPMEYHNIQTKGNIPSNSVILTFDSLSEELMQATGKILKANDHDKLLIGFIINEAKKVFSSPLNDPNMNILYLKDSVDFGGQTIIKNCLELLLISLVRKRDDAHPTITNTNVTYKENRLLLDIQNYLQEHLTQKWTVEDISRHFSISASGLEKLFHHKMNCGVMKYMNRIKIDKANELVRLGTMNFTEIASLLGFSSIHYFSRFYKKVTGMTLSQYIKSIKSVTSISEEKV